MTRLQFLRRYYRGEVFDEWLADLRLRSFAQGGTLAEMLGTPRDGRPGLSDNVHAADEFLRAAEAEGLIVRARHAPTRELCFFGVGGLPVRFGKPSVWSRPVEFAFTVGPREPLDR